MRFPTVSLAIIAVSLAGCGDAAQPDPAGTPLPPFVKTVGVTPGSLSTLGLSGIVRARIESPLSFQVGGRIATRSVDAGHFVKAGQILFELDKRDLEQGVRAAEADLAAANAALATAGSDLARNRQLLEKDFISTQALERVELTRREAQTRRDVAIARLTQARNTLGYGHLRAPASGMLIDVTGEAGQVVAPGQPVALLAQTDDREVEVYFPEGTTPPETGEAVLADGSLALKLRETAGAVDRQGRTLRARYTVMGRSDQVLLGSVIRTRFQSGAGAKSDVSVPLASINERGNGPRVWRVKDGQVTSVPVAVLAIDGETARIRGPLSEGERVVALGTHLLTENMKVRSLGQ